MDTWFAARPSELGAIARTWFELMRSCGSDVRELLHDGAPTACIDEAAFAYVNVFRAHVNVGFYRGAELPDPGGLLAGSGRFMRHVKLGPGREVDTAALAVLVEASYLDMARRVQESRRAAGSERAGAGRASTSAE